jgi:hypothetical protein
LTGGKADIIQDGFLNLCRVYAVLVSADHVKKLSPRHGRFSELTTEQKNVSRGNLKICCLISCSVVK